MGEATRGRGGAVALTLICPHCGRKDFRNAGGFTRHVRRCEEMARLMKEWRR